MHAVVGSRELSEAWAPQVAAVVGFFLGRGWGKTDTTSETSFRPKTFGWGAGAVR